LDRICLDVPAQPRLAAGGELEHDPLVADGQGVHEQLLGGRVELEVVEAVEVEADGERREIGGDLGVIDHDALDPTGAARLYLRSPEVGVAHRLLQERTQDVVDVALGSDHAGIDVELGGRV
jgi:hypothetical protein